MIFALLFHWSGVAAAVAAQREAEARQERVEEAVAKLERLFDALEEAAKEIPRDTFDPQAIVDKVGKDPVKLFEWVRDNTFLIPYRGTLRGPIGVLMDRLGNSLDRALLLHELLMLSGHEARLAHSTLTKEQAEMVLDTARPIPPRGNVASAERHPFDSIDNLIVERADTYGLDVADLERTAKRVALEQQYMAEEVLQQAADHARAILAFVGERDRDIADSERAKAIEALRDHGWVQSKSESDWIDLDPSLPTAQPGATFGPATQSLQPHEIPDELHHQVTIRIAIQQLKGKELLEHTVLEHTLRPSTVFGQHIRLTHIPANWKSDLQPRADVSAFASHLKTSLVQASEWLPVLFVGLTPIMQKGFNDRGEPTTRATRRSSYPALHPPKLWGGFLGSLAGGETGPETYLTAEWIEFIVKVPDHKPYQVRREIFSLVPDATASGQDLEAFRPSTLDVSNRALALAGRTTILPLVSRLSYDFVRHLGASIALSNRRDMVSFLEMGTDPDPQLVLSSLANLSHLSGELYSLALVRGRWSQAGVDVYFDYPNILCHHSRVVLEPNGRWNQTEAIDIVVNEMGARNPVGSSPFRLRVLQGVTDSIAERIVLNAFNRDANPQAAPMLGGREAGEWMLLTQHKDPRWSSLTVPQKQKSRMRMDVVPGYGVLVRSRDSFPHDASVYWWRINLSTGQVVGKGHRGWGQALTEYAEPVTVVLELKSIIGFYADMGRCLGIAMTVPLAGGGAARDALARCVWDVVCGQALGALGAFFDIETNWTNILVQRTVDDVWGSLCKGLRGRIYGS
jgi:hypothetical protein